MSGFSAEMPREDAKKVMKLVMFCGMIFLCGYDP